MQPEDGGELGIRIPTIQETFYGNMIKVLGTSIYLSIYICVFCYSCKLQCQYSMPALNAWAARSKYTTACSIVTQFSGQGCMDGRTTER